MKWQMAQRMRETNILNMHYNWNVQTQMYTLMKKKVFVDVFLELSQKSMK